MSASKYSLAFFLCFSVMGVNAQSQATNDDDDENLNITQTTESEYINISSQVLTRCYLWVDVKAEAASLPIRQGKQNVVVASVQETCNKNNGYTLSIRSANSGFLRTPGQSAGVMYLTTYDGVLRMLDSVKTITITEPRFDDITGVTRDFVFNTNGGVASLVRGTYTDTITLTISSNG